MDNSSWKLIFDNIYFIADYHKFNDYKINIEEFQQKHFVFINNNEKGILVIDPSVKYSNINKKIDKLLEAHKDKHIIIINNNNKNIGDNIINIEVEKLFINPKNNLNICEHSILESQKDIHEIIRIDPYSKIYQNDVAIYWLYPKINDIIKITEFSGKINYRKVIKN